jgi:pimeloyl-ACP methyl ester carboxylesterase
MQRHHLSTVLDERYGRSTRAIWSSAQPDSVIIFIHGFAGDSNTTWLKFPSLLPTLPETSLTDFVYYGYDGKRTYANNSAIEFFDFLNSLLLDPARISNESLPKGAEKRKRFFRYRRVIIVAHSLGAVVARLALLRAHAIHFDQQDIIPWLSTVRLVLFAPAHKGAKAAFLAGFLLSGGNFIFKCVTVGVRYMFPLIDEMVPNSPVLADLTKRTEALLVKRKQAEQTFPDNHLVAFQVIWAGNERVVENIQFCDDPQPDMFRYQNHKTVCKPDTLRHKAIGAIIRSLIGGEK